MMIPNDSCTGSSEALELYRSGVPQQCPDVRNVPGGCGGWASMMFRYPGTDPGLDQMLDRPRGIKWLGFGVGTVEV